MDQDRITARAKRLRAVSRPMPLTPRGDWHGRCTRCGEIVSGTAPEIIAKHKHCTLPGARSSVWSRLKALWLGR